MIPDWLSLIDVAYVAIALLFALGGLQKGFASQIAHILTFIATGVFLFFAYPAMFTYMGRLFRTMEEVYMVWILLAGVVVLAVVFYILISKLLAGALKAQISDRSDRTYGFILGFIRGALGTLITMVFLVILSDKFDAAFSDRSRVGQLVCFEMAPRIQPHFNKDKVGEGINKVREVLIYQEEAGVFEEEKK